MSIDKAIRLVHHVLQRNARERPDKIALIFENQRLTYAQIDEMSDRLANMFCNKGVMRGDRVLVFLPNSVELVISVFATMKANAALVIVDSQTKFGRLQYIAQDCQATALVAGDYGVAARLVQCVASLRLAVIASEEGAAPNILPAGFLAFDHALHRFPPVAPPQEVTGNDLAYLIYTSGSTGEPKGVVVTHRSSLFAIDIDIEYLRLTGQDIIIDALPLSFGYGFHQLIKAFRIGGTLVLERSFVFPSSTLTRLEAERVTGFPCIPTMLARLLQLDLTRFDLTSLRYISSMGAALAPTLIRQIRERLPRVLLFSMYSQTEACNALGLDPAEIDRRPASVGKPLAGTQAWIVDETDRRLGPSEVGELVIAGGHVRSGYWNSPDASAQRFRPGKLPGEFLCYTGDMFKTDEDNYFYFVGRSDEVVKSGGRKVAPREIEDALYRLEGVIEAAVVGIDDPVQGQVLKAFVVVDGATSVTETRVLRHCSRILERFMVPRLVEFRHELPKTATGKINKAELVRQEAGPRAGYPSEFPTL